MNSSIVHRQTTCLEIPWPSCRKSSFQDCPPSAHFPDLPDAWSCWCFFASLCSVVCLFCLGLSVYLDSHYCALLSRELLCVTCLSLCCVVCIVFWFVCVGVCVWRSSVLRCFMLLASALGSAAYSAVATAKAFVVAIHKYLAGPTAAYFAATATGYSADLSALLWP